MARLLGTAVLAAGAFQLVRTVWREAAEYRASNARLRTEWTTIPALVGAGSLRMHARVHDDAAATLPPIVLVHGYGIASSYLVPLAARLGEQARVVAPDLPGHGQSDHDARPLTVPELAEALAAWMDARRLRSAILVGHSMGCQIVAEAAARRPELTAGLVLLAPASDPSARTIPRKLARALACIPFERPSFFALGLLDYNRTSARLLLEEMRLMLAHRVEEVLPRVAGPVRVARGRWDWLAPQAWTETVARLAGAPAPDVIPRWGHAVHYDDPESVAEVVIELARTIPGPSPGEVDQR